MSEESKEDSEFNEAFDAMFETAFTEFEADDDVENQSNARGQLIDAGVVEEGVADMFDMEDMQDDSEQTELA